MKRTHRTVTRLGVGALALASSSLVVGAGAALAAAPYAPDPHTLGSTFLLDSAGHAVSGGASNTPFGAEVSQFVATGQAEAGWRGDDPDATGYAAQGAVYTPVAGTDPNTWTGNPFGPSTTQTNPTVPPHSTLSTGSKTLETIIAGGGGTSVGADANDYEFRLLSINDDQGDADQYYTVDIAINPTAHTWHVIDNAATQGVLTVNPASPATAGPTGSAPVTLTDTLYATDVDGTVQFLDGSAALGTPVTIVNGVASTTANLTAAGSPHALTAVYTPGSGSAFTGDTSNTVSYTVNAAAATPPPTTSLPEAPYAALLPLVGLGALGGVAMRRRRRA